jgi:lipopolysaccharide/colanic/teichoic acid biosynthesis glycosyltransferase
MRPVSSHPDPVVTRLPVRGTGTATRPAWQRGHIRRLLAGDAVCGLAAALAAGQLGLHPGAPVVLLAPLVWVGAVWLAGGYEHRLLGAGPEEFRRTVRAGAVLLAAAGAAAWALDLGVPPGATAVTVVLACVLTLVVRQGQRGWLYRQRALGRALRTTLLVGGRDRVAALGRQLAREPHHGYRVVGCFLPEARDRTVDGLPVLGRLDDVVRVVERLGVDAVAVLPTPGPHEAALHQLCRALELTGVDLVVAPSLRDIAGPRVSIRPSYALPLLHVERPELRTAQRLAKAAFDRGVALLAVAVLLPALLATAVAVKASGRGPVLAHEQRIGRGGRTFGMSTFRTRAVDGAGESGDGVLVRFRRRPRSTPAGLFLRRHGLDQLPKLLDVLRGRVALVGPHPPDPRDVERLASAGHQPVAEPGLTGLSLMTARSDLGREDAAQLEVQYVENWSVALDVVILARTLRVALRGERVR